MVSRAVRDNFGSRMVGFLVRLPFSYFRYILTLSTRHVYTQNLWSFLDVGFIAIYAAYLTLRTYGWYMHDSGPGQQALDVMALAAPVVIPRLGFNLLSDSMVFLSLRAMMGDFAMLTALSAWCFVGFLISLQWLHPGSHDPLYAQNSNFTRSQSPYNDPC